MEQPLQEIPFLASCTRRELQRIRRNADVVTVPAGTVLVREGSTPRWFHAVIDGAATGMRNGEVSRTFGAGDPIGEVSVVRNEAMTDTVVTDTETTVLVMGRREFLGALDETPGLARRLLVPHIPVPETTPAPAPSRIAVLRPVPAA